MSPGTRAQWHLAELTAATQDDPLADTVYSVGLEVDLDGPTEQLESAISVLLAREARFWNLGMVCELKDTGQDCRTCPLATLERSQPRSRLCRLGKDQFAIVERCEDRSRARRAADAALNEDLGAHADEWAELGHLDGDLAELLTAVGL